MVDQKTQTYDPAAKYEVEVSDVEYRKGDGQSWLARIYQPMGTGPFPAILDVHGGAWSGGGRTSAELFDMALASTGIVVAAVDFRVAPEHPYPAQVQDVNYATRWLKANASRLRMKSFTYRAGMAKLKPSPKGIFMLVMPMTSPRRLTSGPPLLPGLIAASV